MRRWIHLLEILVCSCLLSPIQAESAVGQGGEITGLITAPDGSGLPGARISSPPRGMSPCGRTDLEDLQRRVAPRWPHYPDGVKLSSLTYIKGTVSHSQLLRMILASGLSSIEAYDWPWKHMENLET